MPPPQALINVVQNDQGYDLNFTLTDSVGAIVDISNATLQFKGQLLSDHTVNFSGNMVVLSPTAGTCKYTVQATDFEVSGTYNCQIEVNYNFGGIISFPDIQIVVEDEVPVA